ncbi:MAG: DNA starvation/stationary phase protection protein [Edaphocola sp.]
MAKTSKAAPAKTKKQATPDGNEANIGISERNKQAVAADLNKLLSDEFVLYVKTRKFHWNVEGSQFHDLHLFFEKQYDELADIIDEVAERIRKIGHYALGAMQHYLKEASLLESLDNETTATEMLQELLDDHDTVIREMRELIGKFDGTYKDAGSADFITGLVEKHETMAWMLRATAKK